MAPVIILVRPQMGENIGAVARAMSNFGLTELRLVAPRDGWPNRKAMEMASGGQPIIESAKLFASFGEAMADIHTAYATTARSRDMEKRVVTPDEAMGEVRGMNGLMDEGMNEGSRADSAHKAALVFGPERTGLENEEIALCDTLITIPTSPENSSLNLGQSMVVLGYEWFKRSVELRGSSAEQENIIAPHPLPLATKEDWLGLFEQLEAYLDEVNYYRVAHKKPIMWQNLQTMLLRGRWSEQEVRSFRGMLRSIWERETRNR